ncbi:MAG: glycosyltransferase family 92 protein [Anaerolineaceae bacterium]
MYLSLCLIAKDENSYLQEWLDYHILLGVEHFWIYDNESAVPLAKAIKDYIEQGWATVNTIRGSAMQMHAYDHCLQSYGGLSKWIGFIDTDEFLVVHSKETIPAFLTKYEKYGGVAINSLFFGHGGNRKRPAGGQIAGYRMRAPEGFSYSRLVKSIVQPSTVLFPASPHSFFFKENSFCVNEDNNRVDAQEFPCHVEKIQVNHYFTRSVEEWNQKLSRGRGDSVVPYKDERGTWLQNYASVKDTAILDRLKTMLPDAPKNGKTREKKTKGSSRYLQDLLHQEAMKLHPPTNTAYPGSEVTPRPEAVNYYNEMELGLKLSEIEDHQAARVFWLAQIEKYPFDLNRYLNFANACLLSGDFSSAWNALAQAWRIAPKSLYVLLNMADYSYAMGDYAQVEKTSLLCRSLGDLRPENVAMLAIAQSRMGKQKEARITAGPVLDQLSQGEVKNPIFTELFDLFHK